MEPTSGNIYRSRDWLDVVCMVDQVTQDNLTPLVPKPPGLSVADDRCWEHQEAVISAYSGLGTLAKAALAIGLTPEAAYYWQQFDTNGFNQRLEVGKKGYRDYLENMVHERLSNPTGNRGSDVLLMGALNANHPEKWSRNVQVTHEVGREVMATLQKIQEAQDSQVPRLPSPSVEKPWMVEGSVKDEP